MNHRATRNCSQKKKRKREEKNLAGKIGETFDTLSRNYYREVIGTRRVSFSFFLFFSSLAGNNQDAWQRSIHLRVDLPGADLPFKPVLTICMPGFSPRRLIFLTFVGTAGFTAAFALKARSDAAAPFLFFGLLALLSRVFQLREPCISSLSLPNPPLSAFSSISSLFSSSLSLSVFSLLRHSSENDLLRRLFVIRSRNLDYYTNGILVA